MVVERHKPIIDQVNSIIRQRIRNRTYPPGGRLPSEQELAAELGVSRATIRGVLAILAAERLIIRKQGDGTYINKQVREVNTGLGGIWDFTNLIENSGRQAAIQSISTCRRPATSEEITQLHVPSGEQVLELARLFLADQQPVILSSNVVPACILSEGPEDQFEVKLPLHKFLKQYCDQEVAYVISDISAVAVSAEVATLLHCETGAALLRFNEVFYNEENRPLTAGVNYYNHRLLRLRLVQPWG